MNKKVIAKNVKSDDFFFDFTQTVSEANADYRRRRQFIGHNFISTHWIVVKLDTL